jgi:hypothetical protein
MTNTKFRLTIEVHEVSRDKWEISVYDESTGETGQVVKRLTPAKKRVNWETLGAFGALITFWIILISLTVNLVHL